MTIKMWIVFKATEKDRVTDSLLNECGWVIFYWHSYLIMGNEQSSNWDEDYILISQYKNIKKLQNKRTHEQYDIVSVYVTPTSNKKDSVMEQLSKKKATHSAYLIPLERIETAQEPTYCGTKTRYDLVYWEAHPSLSHLMQERTGQNPPFSHNRLITKQAA